jgi:tRNA pseudouridine55 synthase
MDGILNINKPRDMTSFKVVSCVKRITHERHTGHAGTLDPLATGVLPICLGQATRVIEFLFAETKTYRAEIELGKATDSYDCTGKVLKECDSSGVSREMLEAALTKFRGPILQIPPMYSAVKHQGQPLYKLARSGIEVERKSRPARIDRLEIIEWKPPVVTVDIVCGKGTYIRCLAQDLGEVLGCGANMKSLVRLRVGPFSIEEALTLEQLEEAFKQERGEKYLYSVDYVLGDYAAVVVNHEKQCSLIHGAPIVLESTENNGQPSRVYTEDGRFLGMISYDPESQKWQPDKIFLKQCCQE